MHDVIDNTFIRALPPNTPLQPTAFGAQDRGFFDRLYRAARRAVGGG